MKDCSLLNYSYKVSDDLQLIITEVQNFKTNIFI